MWPRFAVRATAVALSVTAAVALTAGSAQSHENVNASAVATKPGQLPVGFVSKFAQLRGFKMHYVEGGHGDAVMMIHGFPQTWDEWHDEMPTLAQDHTVIAVDLRGEGQSGVPASGYDASTLAGDIHQLLEQLHVASGVQIVAHDVGLNVAYAYAAQWRTEVRRMAVMEAPVPDADIYKQPVLNPDHSPTLWHFGLFQLPLAQQLIAGHEMEFTRGFIGEFLHEQSAFTSADYQYYASFLRQPGRLLAWLKVYRALPQDVIQNAGYLKQGKLQMPILAIGAQQSFGTKVGSQWHKYASNVRFVLLPNSGHWVTEEQPVALTRALSSFLV